MRGQPWLLVKPLIGRLPAKLTLNVLYLQIIARKKQKEEEAAKWEKEREERRRQRMEQQEAIAREKQKRADERRREIEARRVCYLLSSCITAADVLHTLIILHLIWRLASCWVTYEVLFMV